MDGPKRQQRAEATRAHLLASARTVFAQRGYQATSVAAITDAAATAHGTFYLYFKNKEDVFGEVMAAMLDELYRHSFTPFDELGDRYDHEHNRERIAAFLAVIAAEAGLWRALLEAVLACPSIEEQWLSHRTRFHEGLADRIRRFQASGELDPYDADEVAYALGGMLEWYALTGAAFATPRTLADDERAIDSLAALWTRALGSEVRNTVGADQLVVGSGSTALVGEPVAEGVTGPVSGLIGGAHPG